MVNPKYVLIRKEKPKVNQVLKLRYNEIRLSVYLQVYLEFSQEID